MVFDSAFPKIELATYDMTRTIAFSWDWYKEHVVRGSTSMARFVRQISSPYAQMESDDLHAETSHFNMCDAGAIAAFLEPEHITKQKFVHCAIETGGTFARGATLFDWAGLYPQYKKNCNVVMAYNKARFEQMWLDLLKIDS